MSQEKEKAKELVIDEYELAKKAYENQIFGDELRFQLWRVKGAVEMAKGLGLMTEEEVKEIHDKYFKGCLKK